MKSISTLIASSLLLGASTVSAYGASAPGPVVYKGCYSTSTGLSLNSSYTFNTQGYCQTQCAPLSYNVLATSQSTDCYCGNEIPPSGDLVSDSYCSSPCAGYGQDMCGGTGYWSVWLSGVSASASTAAGDSSTSATASATKGGTQTTAATPSVVTVGGSTVVVTAPADNSGSSSASATTAPSSSKGGTNKAAIAAGVVVGVAAIAAIAGGVFLFMRHRKRREVEEEYRRNAAVNSFMAGKPPNSSGGDSSFTDTRLDPAVMAQRRMSDGSIADNQDYSRRILQVRNA